MISKMNGEKTLANKTEFAKFTFFTVKVYVCTSSDENSHTYMYTQLHTHLNTLGQTDTQNTHAHKQT